MRYSELIEKYAKGELENEKSAVIESEIEKHEAIADYIAERDEKELSELRLNDAEPETEKTDDFTRGIKRQIRKSFIKAGLITGLAAVAAMLFVMFALPGLVSKAYYDPAEKVGTDIYDNEVNRLTVDLAAYTELFIPENVRQTARAEAEGYGKYTVYIPQEYSITGVFRDAAGMIKKNRLTLYDPNLLKLPPANIFETHRAGVSGEAAYESGWEFDAAEYLKGFGESGKRTVYVTLDRPMSYTEFADWCGRNEVSPFWCAVCSQGSNPVPCSFGFLCNAPAPLHGLTGKLADKYPALIHDGRQDYVGEGELRLCEDEAKAHLTDMLMYLADDPTGLAVLMGEDREMAASFCADMTEAAYSIEVNGFQVYGFMILLDKAEAERLISLEEVIWLFNGSVQ